MRKTRSRGLNIHGHKSLDKVPRGASSQKPPEALTNKLSSICPENGISHSAESRQLVKGKAHKTTFGDRYFQLNFMAINNYELDRLRKITDAKR